MQLEELEPGLRVEGLIPAEVISGEERLGARLDSLASASMAVLRDRRISSGR